MVKKIILRITSLLIFIFVPFLSGKVVTRLSPSRYDCHSLFYTWAGGLVVDCMIVVGIVTFLITFILIKGEH